MERRHFEAIAAVLLASKPAEPRRPSNALPGETVAKTAAVYRQWEQTVQRFAAMLNGQNVQFKRDVFLRACGLSE